LKEKCSAKKRQRISKEELERRKKEQEYKERVVQRMKDKIQKNFNKNAQVNDADRKIGSSKPMHLNTGKRGIGKTDRR